MPRVAATSRGAQRRTGAKARSRPAEDQKLRRSRCRASRPRARPAARPKQAPSLRCLRRGFSSLLRRWLAAPALAAHQQDVRAPRARRVHGPRESAVVVMRRPQGLAGRRRGVRRRCRPRDLARLPRALSARMVLLRVRVVVVVLRPARLWAPCLLALPALAGMWPGAWLPSWHVVLRSRNHDAVAVP